MVCSGILLCGGRGRRAGGVDKGRLPYAGHTLAEQVLCRISPQVDDVVVSANRNLDWYGTLGHPVVRDCRADFQGPLAGLEAALPLCSHEAVLVVCCDMPELPRDLVTRLVEPLKDSGVDLCFAHDGERDHYLVALLRRSLLEHLGNYLDSGGRSVRGWYRQLRCRTVDFNEERAAFLNINIP
jgi:molybdopterin-guanine dinucleotide biosynthesis protein A